MLGTGRRLSVSASVEARGEVEKQCYSTVTFIAEERKEGGTNIRPRGPADHHHHHPHLFCSSTSSHILNQTVTIHFLSQISEAFAASRLSLSSLLLFFSLVDGIDYRLVQSLSNLHTSERLRLFASLEQHTFFSLHLFLSLFKQTCVLLLIPSSRVNHL